MNTLHDGFSTFMNLLWVKCSTVCVAVVFCISSSVLADTRALPDGQANIAGQFDDIDLELSGVANSVDQGLGFRFTFKRIFNHFVFFIDQHRSESALEGIAQGGAIDVSGVTYGAGMYITGLPNLGAFTTNLRLSGQREDLDVDSHIVVSGIQAEATVENRTLDVALLLSPVTPIFGNGGNVYMSLGASYLTSRRDVQYSDQNRRSINRDENEYVPQAAIGIVYPLNRIKLFASAEYEEEFALGLGVRLQLSNFDGR